VDKRALFEKLIQKLETERMELAQAALNTYEAATHEESEPEDQYDTRGLEASYLAGAQAKRVAAVEQMIATIRQIGVKKFGEDDSISSTALVELDHDGKSSFCLLLPQGGGIAIDHEGHHIQVITPQSPLGEAILGRQVGDVASVDVGKETHEYEIVSIS
jgi:transcription elongation GreA/GreB family factor